jgi:hypothetical protein
VGLEVFARCGDGFFDFVEDVQTAFASLVEGAFKDFVAQTVT